MSAALTTNGLGHRYGHRYGRHHWGLQDCSLTIEAGSVVALIGPNGSGKTTLLNMAAGLLQPTSGSVEIHGRSPDRQLERVGYVAQDAPLWPRLRVADVLDIGACMNPRFDRPFAEQRVRDLDVPFKSRIGNLSGGQRAQVALTLVLAKRPDLLLLDEPLANLDPVARRHFLASMLTVCADTGVAVVFSSHVVAELERICDHLVVLRSGRVQLAGDIDELRAGHRIVTGPEGWPETTAVPVISSTSAGRRSVALVRADSAVLTGPGFDEAPPTFDELAMGYLTAQSPQLEEVPA